MFPEHAGVGTPYLFEGSGYRFADYMLDVPGTHEPVPLVIDRLQPGDVIAITSPSGFSTPWRVCGNDLPGGETTLLSDLLSPPCVHDENMAAISVVVPVDADYDSGQSLSIETTRGNNIVFETQVPVLPLAEFVGGAPGDNTLYASIRVVNPITGTPGGPPFEWNAVSDISVSSSVNLDGLDGQDSNSAKFGEGFAGGAGVAGGGSGGSSNCGAMACGGVGPAAGQGAGSCGGSSGVPYTSAGGGGGGNALPGMVGNAGLGNCPSAGGAQGTQLVGDNLLYILDLQAASGSGGGAGGTVTNTSTSSTLYGGGGGGGGGSIGIHTPGQVFLNSGGISATGGRGGNTAFFDNASKVSGRGGAGSGGAIRIQAGDIHGDAPLDVRGGPTPSGGRGGGGFIRLDGRNTSAVLPSGTVRGPDSDIASAISSDGQWLVRIYSEAGKSFTWGYRSAGAVGYVLVPGTSTGGAVTLLPNLEPGLHELCVFAVAPGSGNAADIEATNKHCVWRAIVPQDR